MYVIYCLQVVYTAVLYSAGCFNVIAVSQEVVSDADPSYEMSEADRIMTALAGGRFEPLEEIRPLNGWIITTETGKTFSRSTLQYQAERIIAIGPLACGDLLKWVEHEEMQIRYIAFYSFQQITGRRLVFNVAGTKQQVIDSGVVDEMRKIIEEM